MTNALEHVNEVQNSRLQSFMSTGDTGMIL